MSETGSVSPMPAPLRLYSSGLLSKWGFSDGETPDDVFDYLDRLEADRDVTGLPTTAELDWRQVLVVLVRLYLLPKLDQNVEVEQIQTSHNPIRAVTIDSVVSDHLGDDLLTPEFVDIPFDVIHRVIRDWWAWAKAPVGSSRVSDLTTGEVRIEPPAKPISPEAFIAQRPRDTPPTSLA